MKKFSKSLNNALSGLRYAIVNERNFQIEIIAAVIVIALVMFLNLENWEMVVLFLLIGWVLTVELINTVVERIVNILKPRVHPYAGLIKDIMAAVVLISSALAFIIGVVILYPYFCDFWIK